MIIGLAAGVLIYTGVMVSETKESKPFNRVVDTDTEGGKIEEPLAV